MIGIHSSQKNIGIHNPLEQPTESVDLTPLMDVLFILLVFFLLTSGITQFYTQVQLPQSENLLETTIDHSNTILIEMFAQDQSWKVNEETIHDYDQLKQVLLDLHHSQKNVTFVLAPERTISAERLLQLLNFLASHKMTDVQIINKWGS
ncbi:MAG: biopolymer transporter ExbD [SAR324 cluster bacterium]|nr:biopolymer transporter ExbD [SAR324 cluster bacterium]